MSETDWAKRWREICVETGGSDCRHREKDAVQLGREMADARAEEIARKITDAARSTPVDARMALPNLGAGLMQGADIARATITKPKTREPALEAALRSAKKIFEDCPDIVRIVNAALEEK